MRPDYLSGERLYLRAPTKADAEVSTAWYPSIFPMGPGRAEAYLKDHLKATWGPGRILHLMIVQSEDDRVVGGVIVEQPRGPGAVVAVRVAPFLSPEEADGVQADALRLLVPWLLREAEVLTVTVGIGADHSQSLAAAQDVGLATQSRLREYLARPGGRCDLFLLQALNLRLAPTVPREDGVAPGEGDSY